MQIHEALENFYFFPLAAPLSETDAALMDH
jgi:hypothetical protein